MASAKVALVTGSNSGVGLALSVLLAKEYRVYATMRSLGKGDELRKQAEAAGVRDNIVVAELDVNDDESVEHCFAMLKEKEGRIDVLVNNAGYSVFGGVELLDLDACQAQFNTNFFGVIRTQKAALPMMRAQKSGKIVNVSSVGGVWGQPFNDVYCASKFALEGMCESQNGLFRNFGIYQTCVEPGGISTSFIANAARPGQEKIPAEYLPFMASTIKAYQTNPRVQTAEEVAQVIVEKVVNVAKPPARVQTNEHIQGVFEAQLTDPSGEKGIALQSRFF